MEMFCYRGDMFSSYGLASDMVIAKIGSAWKKFGELSRVLIGTRGLSLKQRGKIYQSCVKSVLLYCIETGKCTVADV